MAGLIQQQMPGDTEEDEPMEHANPAAEQQDMAEDQQEGEQDDAGPIKAQIEQELRAKLSPELNKAMDKVIVAGMKVMFSPETHQLALKEIEGDDMPEDVGRGVANLLMMLFQESRGTMPMEAGIPGAVVLCIEALEFLEKAGAIEVTKETVARSVQSLFTYVMQGAGISKEKMGGMMAAAKQGQAGGPQGLVGQAQGAMA